MLIPLVDPLVPAEEIRSSRRVFLSAGDNLFVHIYVYENSVYMISCKYM